MSSRIIAVAGNPNAGKTTLFNAMTGARARVANYPGVTVERKEADACLPNGTVARVIDLPGCYSLVARSPEEEVAHHLLLGQLGDARPEVVICVVDATNLARGLYLVAQLIDLELPVVVALNMIDVARERQLGIDTAELARRLGVPVIETAAKTGLGVPQLLERIDELLAAGPPETRAIEASAVVPRPLVDSALRLRSGRTDPSGPSATISDPTRGGLALDLGEHERAALDELGRLLAERRESTSLGHRLWLVCSNLDALSLPVAPELSARVTELRKRLDDLEPEPFARRVIARRYRQIDELLTGVVDRSRERRDRRSEQLDRFLLHPFLGPLALALTMFVVFQAIFTWAEPLIAGVEALIGLGADGVRALVPEGLVRSLLTSGLLAGVGNVLVFVPQIALLFLLLSLLEESGYLARAAFLLDRVMRRVGLHGKAFVPLLSGFACAVPAVMSTRTIETARDRLVTILVTPFMSCSARLPVYVLVIGAVFSGAAPLFGFVSVGALVTASMYALGFVAAIVSAWFLKSTVLTSPPPALVLELPAYQVPTVKAVARRVFERSAIFVRETGSVILALSLVMWALLSFPALEIPAGAPVEARPALEAKQLEHSFAGRLGHAIEPAIEPLGFDWRIGIGLVASFAAREVLVTTLGQVYALGTEVEADSPLLRQALLAEVDPVSGRPTFTPLVGVSLMVFYVLALQCLSTVAAVRRETNSWRWPLAQLVAMNVLAYVASLVTYQTGVALGLG